MYDQQKAHYVVATVIIINKEKYLIVKRADYEKAFPGLWTVPGGKLETTDYKDKKPDTNAGQWYNVIEELSNREVKEETGLEIDKIKYLASLAFIRPDGVPTLVLSMFADYKGGDVVLGEGLTDHAWVTLEEAKNYKLIDGIYEELEMLDRLLKGESIGVWQKK